MKQFILTILTAMLCLTARAQYDMRVHYRAQSTSWTFPYAVDSIAELSADGPTISLYTRSGKAIELPKALVDSLTFDTLAADERKDPYQVYHLYLTTDGGERVESNTTYVPCFFALNGDGSYSNRSADAGIRQRGNSSRLWYDKKPYRLKLDSKQKMLGMGKAKSWVLLANYRDVTDLMNTFVFECGRWLGMPSTNHTRYVEVFLNGDYIGLYQLTEQIQQGKNRVDIDDQGGILLALDLDDGPDLSPKATDNFWSDVYDLPVCVKYPDDDLLTPTRKDSVRQEFATLESAIKSRDFTLVDSLMDVRSFIHYLQLQELVENVELVSPRSVYIYKEAAGKWVMGPLWDFDAGYDFDWANMYTGHNYFSNYRELVLGSDPANHYGCYDRNIPYFFTDLFGCREFVQLYKDEWTAISDSLISRNWAIMERYLDGLRQGAIQRDMERWPIAGKHFETEVASMKKWLTNRVAYLNTVIAAYPMPEIVGPTPTTQQDCGTMNVTVDVQRSRGYTQRNKIVVDRSTLCQKLGLSSWAFSESNASLVPLNGDGSEGGNHTNGIYGGWFDEDGDPGYWEAGHTYIEVTDDLFNWACGIHPQNCLYDSQHTVVMQMRYVDGTTVKRLNINVTFRIS